MHKPNYQLITLAREASGLTQAELATSIGIEQGYLSKIENGLSIEPSPEIIKKIAYVLEYPESFFYQEWTPIRVEGHYRRKLSLPVKDLKECKAKMTFAERHLTILCQSIELPAPNYPTWNIEVDGSPTLCGRFLRELWKIPKGRVLNPISILEDNGFVIIELDLGEVDGFSTLSDNNTPIIFLNKNMPGDRYRLTAMHEAIHFVLHHGQKICEEREIEKEAYEGAVEFLVPFSDVEDQLRKLSLPKLADLKQYWGVSMQSLIVRAFRTELISKHQYQYLFKQMNALNYRKKEPIEIPKEKPTLFHEILSTHITDLGYSKEELAELLQMMPRKLDEWYYGRSLKLKALRKI